MSTDAPEATASSSLPLPIPATHSHSHSQRQNAFSFRYLPKDCFSFSSRRVDDEIRLLLSSPLLSAKFGNVCAHLAEEWSALRLTFSGRSLSSMRKTFRELRAALEDPDTDVRPLLEEIWKSKEREGPERPNLQAVSLLEKEKAEEREEEGKQGEDERKALEAQTSEYNLTKNLKGSLNEGKPGDVSGGLSVNDGAGSPPSFPHLISAAGDGDVEDQQKEKEKENGEGSPGGDEKIREENDRRDTANEASLSPSAVHPEEGNQAGKTTESRAVQTDPMGRSASSSSSASLSLNPRFPQKKNSSSPESHTVNQTQEQNKKEDTETRRQSKDAANEVHTQIVSTEGEQEEKEVEREKEEQPVGDEPPLESDEGGLTPMTEVLARAQRGSQLAQRKQSASPSRASVRKAKLSRQGTMDPEVMAKFNRVKSKIFDQLVKQKEEKQKEADTEKRRPTETKSRDGDEKQQDPEEEGREGENDDIATAAAAAVAYGVATGKLRKDSLSGGIFAAAEGTGDNEAPGETSGEDKNFLTTFGGPVKADNLEKTPKAGNREEKAGDRLLSVLAALKKTQGNVEERKVEQAQEKYGESLGSLCRRTVSLDLSNNRLAGLSFADLAGERKEDKETRGVESIFPSLARVDLSSNCFTVLNVSRNRITEDLPTIQAVLSAQMPELKRLTIHPNPLTKSADIYWRPLLLAALPRLREVDGRPLSDLMRRGVQASLQEKIVARVLEETRAAFLGVVAKERRRMDERLGQLDGLRSRLRAAMGAFEDSVRAQANAFVHFLNRDVDLMPLEVQSLIRLVDMWKQMPKEVEVGFRN
uniref:Uncharacterized protein n=1 Tax=Chromera velia CCMP2878 TaxID=1169474 RepID=A0A0K6SB76_9ALVE|eukprot:Cvel_13422.t2-p1 / transcript=Cvel_13422.t2 / gene=Cvel_13422 / organism=Chromera_velia_CCMP2878 / gene_product=hypothetical protein / transcript_product=hypothetical protein / location=Cvel_scaffold915:52602-59509(-) / protein_length=815 / sequence_SO=supercontig / SO=protein_coding / is_pseudo=false